MAAERIVAEHVVEGGVQALLGHAPRDESAACEARREQRLAHAADRAGLEHGADALDDDVLRRLRTAAAIVPSGSRWKPRTRSSETARIATLIGSSMVTGTPETEAASADTVVIAPDNAHAA